MPAPHRRLPSLRHWQHREPPDAPIGCWTPVCKAGYRAERLEFIAEDGLADAVFFADVTSPLRHTHLHTLHIDDSSLAKVLYSLFKVPVSLKCTLRFIKLNPYQIPTRMYIYMSLRHSVAVHVLLNTVCALPCNQPEQLPLTPSHGVAQDRPPPHGSESGVPARRLG